MILKIFILIMLIVILAGKPQLKPKGWPEGKPWPPPKPKPKDGIVVTCPKKKEAIKKVRPGIPKIPKKPPPKKKSPPKKGGKRSFWDPPIPAVKCQPGRTLPVIRWLLCSLDS